MNHFTVIEAGGSRGLLNAQATSDVNTVEFGVAVQGNDMPYIIPVDIDPGEVPQRGSREGGYNKFDFRNKKQSVK